MIFATALQAQRPSVTTQQVVNILENSAVVNGNVSTDPSFQATQVGFVWAKTEFPTRSNNDGIVFLNAGNGDFNEEIENLEPETRYYVRMFAANEKGLTYGKNLAFETLSFDVARSLGKVSLVEGDLASVDSDNDGIINSFEDDAPNGGDANNDAIDDKLQANVITINELGSQNLQTIVVSGCSNIYNATNQSQIDTSGYIFPFGTTQFVIPCDAATVKIIYHNVTSLDGYVYRKITSQGVWYNVAGASFSEEIVGGKQVATVTLSLNDNDPEDYDGLDNDFIHDPGGPAFLIQSSNIPVFNNTSRAIVILLLIAIAFGINRFRNS